MRREYSRGGNGRSRLQTAKQKKKRRQERTIRILGGVLCLTAVALGGLCLAKGKVSFLNGKTPKSAVEQAEKEEPKKEEFHALDQVTAADVNVTRYDTYGTSLNIEGNLEVADANIVQALDLVLRKSTVSGEEEDIEPLEEGLSYSLEGNTIQFATSEKITDGICMEQIPEGKYCMLLKVIHQDGTGEYHSMTDPSSQESVEYYTLTKNGKNDRIEVAFSNAKETSAEKDMAYLALDCQEAELPEDVYDIVVDAGHGGNDPGSSSGSYTEAGLMLDYALSVYDELTKAGYKVKLTRDGSESADLATCFNMYDTDGRVTVTLASKAKYCLCLHLNSNEQAVRISGVQVYCTNRGNGTIAKRFADNIVSMTGTGYSGMQSYKVADGVYSRAYTAPEIEKAAKSAQEAGYEEYPITTSTDYYYMVRETGGLATGAYIDGRNPKFGSNEYRNSNHGVACFLLELGYISEDVDLQNLLNRKSDYVDALVTTVEETVDGFMDGMN